MKHKKDIAECTLASLRPGESACVTRLDDASPLSARLEDIGISEGTHILCERISLMGDPCAYRICGKGAVSGTVVALRQNDAVHIEITKSQTAESCVDVEQEKLQKARQAWV